MKKIEMRRVTEFEGFNPKRFCVKPNYWNYKYVPTNEAEAEFEEAKRLAKDVDGICIAVIHDNLGDYVLGESSKEWSPKFILFNAVKTTRSSAELRAIAFDKGPRSLSNYWYDSFIKYQKGGIA